MSPDAAATPASRTLPTRDGYDAWSGLYDVESNPLVMLEERVVVARLAGVVEGARAGRGRARAGAAACGDGEPRVLDVGCGTGRHAVRLAMGGTAVTAMDFSRGMLAQARGKPGAERVRWVEHDLAVHPWPVEVGGFDVVLSALVLDHVRDVGAFFESVARALAPGGRAVLTVMHPAMMLRGVQARFTDPASGERVMPASAANEISDYVMGAVRAGLSIEHLSEHRVDAELVAASPRAEKHSGWPLLFVMEAGKGVA